MEFDSSSFLTSLKTLIEDVPRRELCNWTTDFLGGMSKAQVISETTKIVWVDPESADYKMMHYIVNDCIVF